MNHFVTISSVGNYVFKEASLWLVQRGYLGHLIFFVAMLFLSSETELLFCVSDLGGWIY